jgi:hypothetical protein
MRRLSPEHRKFGVKQGVGGALSRLLDPGNVAEGLPFSDLNSVFSGRSLAFTSDFYNIAMST